MYPPHVVAWGIKSRYALQYPTYNGGGEVLFSRKIAKFIFFRSNNHNKDKKFETVFKLTRIMNSTLFTHNEMDITDILISHLQTNRQAFMNSHESYKTLQTTIIWHNVWAK